MEINNRETDSKEYYVVDWLHILKSIASRAWVVAICAIVAAAIGFSIAAFLITPKYSASIMIYVDNVSSGATDGNVSSSQLTAAQSLVKTYGVFLDNETTFEAVKQQLKNDGKPISEEMSYRDFSDMIKSAPEQDTEVMRVTVTCDDPEMAADIANAIFPVLEDRISEIIKGASVKSVQKAIPDYDKVSPGIAKYTIVSFVLGALASVIALAVAAMLDKTIHDEEYVLQTFGYPILAKIPNLIDTDGSKHYYRHYYSYGHRRHRGYYQTAPAKTENKEG
jgi:capsular polysaccharide biosynthesis protein